jgi:hypothetical protein
VRLVPVISAFEVKEVIAEKQEEPAHG